MADYIIGSREDPEWAWYWAESDADEQHGRDLCDPLDARVLTATEGCVPISVVEEVPKVRELHDLIMEWVPVIYHEEIDLWRRDVRICDLDYDIPQRTRYTFREKAVRRYEDTCRIMGRHGMIHVADLWSPFDDRATIIMVRNRIRQGSKTRAALASSIELDKTVTRAQVDYACKLMAERSTHLSEILSLSYLVY